MDELKGGGTGASPAALAGTTTTPSVPWGSLTRRAASALSAVTAVVILVFALGNDRFPGKPLLKMMVMRGRCVYVSQGLRRFKS